MNFPLHRRAPLLSDDEWATIESFLGHAVADRGEGNHAFWEDTYAHDHGLLDNFNRLAWLGDRVLNLALADRREAIAEPMKRWNGTGYQTEEQSQLAAVDVWWAWPPPVQEMLRLGNAKKGEANYRILGTYVEALVGLVFREHGYAAAREFVWKHWPYSE
jgi:dsRNA-specific ribonuclease